MTENEGGHKGGDRLGAPMPQDFSSAHDGDPLIVHTPRPRGFLRRCARALTIFAGLILLLVGGCFLLLEIGAFDGPLTSRAQTLLQNAVGDRYVARVESSRVRLAKRGLIALEAREAGLWLANGDTEVVHATKVKIALEVMPLLSGKLTVSHVEVDGGFVDAALIGRGAGNSTGTDRPFEIADLEPITARGLAFVRSFSDALRRLGTQRIFLANTAIAGVGSANVPITIVSAEVMETGVDSVDIQAKIAHAGQDISLEARASPKAEADGRMQLSTQVTGVHLGKLIGGLSGNQRQKFRMESGVEIDFLAVEGDAQNPVEAKAELDLSAGELFMDGVAAELDPSYIKLALDPQNKKLEIEPSRLDISSSSYSFNGGIIDLQNLPGETEQGFAVDLLVDDAVVAPTDSSEPAVHVAMKVFARFLRSERRLYVDDFIVSGKTGTMFSSASVRFSDTSPEISFVANIEKMDTTSVKQLWPYWIAKQARNWVLENLFGGTVSDGAIRVFIPEGRMAAALPNSLDLNGSQLQIDFNIENARFDVAGDIPPVRNADGLLTLRGKHLELRIDKGTSYFPTGRNVGVSNGLFVIDHTDARPLMASLDIDVTGEAAAVAELISYRPINALQQTPYKPEDFEGSVSSKVRVTFGLIQNQNPPSPDWHVELDLNGVSIGPKVDGVKVTDATGRMHVDTTTIKIDAEADLNGMRSQLEFTEPLEAENGVETDRVVKMQVTEADRAIFAPQLNEMVKGTVFLTAKLEEGGRQIVDADFTEAQLILPWIGWSKGKGIKATATFEMVPEESEEEESVSDAADDPEDAGQHGLGMPDAFAIRNFDLTGEGFSAKGDFEFLNGELVNAAVSRVSLSRNDSFAVNIALKGGTYHVDVAGKSIDLRSSIKHLIAETDSEPGSAADQKVELKVRADRASGFGGEVLKPFRLDYTGKGNTILGLELKAVTDTGRGVDGVGRHDGSGLILTIASDDAGAVARFADIYDNIEGGTLDIQLTKAGNGPYIGTVNLGNFDVVDDEHLKKLVSSNPQGGESLNQAVRREIDVSRARFQHAFARIDMGPGYLRLGDGIARGAEVGFAFQGAVYDSRTGMDIAGTFMPAYGLNRIFGEIPVLGIILGNGRDRGLIGITFRMTGSLDDPILTINPISLIAPGIFRQIFQFRSDGVGSGAQGKYNFRSETR
ncbi:DUF3971 domain-containing protein [Hoeflea poritis]|uniref:DUF3971 domain-containing protein n=1 Tax=Hoeflea poritis TaxID=2993659 RepID=A0ABT4VSV4_9HYPH|nr:DUF3971 domain-containing protein [Hoeflea poritis]MDA4847802.1 DUF3971 domain-containing protein [Hoeflea poritis]